MQQERVKSTATTLNSLLKRYAPSDKEAVILQHTVGDIFNQALVGQLQSPVALRNVPGDRFILESHLIQTHRDLTDAFMLFKLAITDQSHCIHA